MPEFLAWLSQVVTIVMAYVTQFFGVVDMVPRWLWVLGYFLAILQTKQARGAGRKMSSSFKSSVRGLVKR